jgi:hypothetical protein
MKISMIAVILSPIHYQAIKKEITAQEKEPTLLLGHLDSDGDPMFKGSVNIDQRPYSFYK